MLCLIQSRRSTFQHNLNARLLAAVAVSRKRAVLFYSNRSYFVFDTFTNKVGSEHTLQYTPYKCQLLNDTEILCLFVQNKQLVKINFEENVVTKVAQFPVLSSGDIGLDASIFWESQLEVFTATGIFYIGVLYKLENRRKIWYLPDPAKGDYELKEFHGADTICERADESSKVAIYHQHVQQDVDWELKILDLAEGSDHRIVVTNPLLKVGQIISKVLVRNKEELYLFLNGEYSRILILTLSNSDLTQTKFHLSPNFLDVLFYNQQKQLACLSYLHPRSNKGEVTENRIQVVNLDKQQLLADAELSLKGVSVPLRKEYILDVAEEGSNGQMSILHSRHFLRKKALIFHIVQKSGIFNLFGHGLGRPLLSLFDF